MAELSRIGVLGCGLMGHGITQVAAQSGYDVVVREVDQDRLDKGIGRIDKQLARAVEKGRMEQADAEAARGRITPTLEYGDLADSDIVIEAIVEDLAAQDGDVARRWTGWSARHDLRQQHLVAAGHRPGGGDVAAGAHAGAALLQPGAGDEAGGGSAA